MSTAPTGFELALAIAGLVLVLALIVAPHVADWWQRKADEGEPDYDDDERGGL